MQTNQARHPALIAFAGFIVGVLVASAWYFESKLGGTAVPAVPAPAATTTVASGENTDIVMVRDQPAGEGVTIDSVDVASPVWAAVVEMRGDDLGNILGAARVLSSDKPVSVPLLRATLPRQEYAVVLYRDNGDGVFDAKTDSLYIDFSSDARVVAPFRAY